MANQTQSKTKKTAKLPKLHVKKGDTVMVIAGKDKGKTGLVKQVFPARQKAIVEGLNMVKKATRPNPMIGQPGGFIEKEMPLFLSKLMLFDLKSEKPTRTRREQIQSAEGKPRWVRVSKKNGEQMDV